MKPVRARVLSEGLVAGLLGYVVIALFFGSLHLVSGQSLLHTAAALGARDVSSLPVQTCVGPPQEPDGRCDEEAGPSVPGAGTHGQQHAQHSGRHMACWKHLGQSYPGSYSPAPKNTPTHHALAHAQEPCQGSR